MMDKFKAVLRKIFFLPPAQTVLFALVGYAMVLCVAAFEIDIPALKYISYLASAYALVITITGFKKIVRAARKFLRENRLTKALLKIPIVKRYSEDAIFRARVSLYFGLIINVAYIGIKLVSGIYYRSVWLVALAVYYILLAIMRFFLVQYDRRHSFGERLDTELRHYRLIGIMLLVMNIALAGIVVLVVWRNQGFEYPGLLIYAMAIYSFYTTAVAVINVVKYRKHGSPAVSAAKVLNLVAAAVSMLSLTTAMLSEFGEDDREFRRLMTGLVGGGVCLLVLVMAVFMIVRATRRINKINETET